MQIVLLGKNGQLGWELHRTLQPLGNVVAFDLPEIDLSKPDTYLPKISALSPGLIINATAYTAVDRAENEPDLAHAVNGHAPGILAEFAAKAKAVFIHYSTDYVFDGTQETPYRENDSPEPINTYGLTKLAGERAVQAINGSHLILRTSWVYSLRGDSFVTKVLHWSRHQPTLRIVTDQIANPTWARMLAEITTQALVISGKDPYGWFTEHGGLYHLAGRGIASRYEWATAILDLDPHKEQQVVSEVLPAQSSDFLTPAKRPLNSSLNCDLFYEVFGLQLPDWREALALAITPE